jgi:hypothetical protein
MEINWAHGLHDSMLVIIRYVLKQWINDKIDTTGGWDEGRNAGEIAQAFWENRVTGKIIVVYMLEAPNKECLGSIR